MEQLSEIKHEMGQQSNPEQISAIEDPLVLEDIVLETLAIDGICGVY